jgi:hypothetical protein
MKKIVALALVAALAVVAGVAWNYIGHEDDPFVAKYG